MTKFFTTVLQRPAIRHLLAAVTRYNRRLGPQFAAAIAFFSFLSMVPTLMFLIAGLGWTVTVLRPELWDSIRAMLELQLGAGQAGNAIGEAASTVLNNWQSISVAAIVTAAYTGSRWAGNLKRALRVMWRDDITRAGETRFFLLEILMNLVLFVGLLTMVVAGFAITIAGVGFSENIVAWLGYAQSGAATAVVRGISVMLTWLAGWILFVYIFLTMPGEIPNKRGFLGGTIAGGFVIMAVQQAAGILVKLFSNNLAVAFFGQVIVFMLVFNVLSMLILLIAAWVGTTEYATKDAPDWTKERDLLKDPVSPVHAAVRERIVLEERAPRRTHSAFRTTPTVLIDPQSKNSVVPVRAALRYSRIVSKVSYLLGAMAGVGVGALWTAWKARKHSTKGS